MTQDSIRRLFDYTPETGELTWRVSPSNNVQVGSKAGYLSNHGYRVVKVSGDSHMAHRVIWLWAYGYLPEHDIDHINRDKADNRLKNLREVTRACNVRNSGQLSNNTSGVTGVFWHDPAQKWVAQITATRQHHLGYFSDFTEAVLHRLAAEQCLDWPGCNSSTDAYQYLANL